MGRKRREPKTPLSAEEAARVAALRQARVLHKNGSPAKGTSARAAWLAQAAEKRLAQQAQQRERDEKDRSAVAALSRWHVSRMLGSDADHVPWDDEFILEIQRLLDGGLPDRAKKVALAVAADMISWRAPQSALWDRLQQASTPVAAAARANATFMRFIRGQVMPAHRRWVKDEEQKELTRLRASQPAPVSDWEAEQRRQEATARRRPIAKGY